MKTNIYIPDKINVGFQERKDTYTGKLAYIIYWDAKKKLRKEHSWNSWRDNKIEPKVFDNVPTEGFVLNKKVGGYNTGWNQRQTYTRVYDPRGFEFEISISNLLYLLENTSCIKGKGLEGEMVYGWSGKDIVLIPVDSPDYKEINDYVNIMKNMPNLKGKDMVTGATYLDKDGEEMVYMGRFDYYCKHKEVEKKYFFARDYITSYNNRNNISISTYKTLGKNVLKEVNSETSLKYAEYMEYLESRSSYSPYDKSKDEIVPMSLNEFQDIITIGESGHYKSAYFGTYNNIFQKILVEEEYNTEMINGEYTRVLQGYGVSIEESYTYYDYYNSKRKKGCKWEIKETVRDLQELFNRIQPHIKNRYGSNGKFQRRERKNEW